MTDRNEWVAEVRRWYLARETSPERSAASTFVDESDPALAAIGYESAVPALQHGWPGAAPEAR